MPATELAGTTELFFFLFFFTLSYTYGAVLMFKKTFQLSRFSLEFDVQDLQGKPIVLPAIFLQSFTATHFNTPLP